jgi:hypothetical protein
VPDAETRLVLAERAALCELSRLICAGLDPIVALELVDWPEPVSPPPWWEELSDDELRHRLTAAGVTYSEAVVPVTNREHDFASSVIANTLGGSSQ